MKWLEKNIVLSPKETILIDTDKPDRDKEGNYLVDIAYRRVSTEKQSLDGFGLQAQLDKIMKVCRQVDSNACILLTDDGFTGTVMERPGLNCFVERLNAFNDGETNIRIRRFIIPRLDRLGRNLVGTLRFIQDYILPEKNNKSPLNHNRYLVEFFSEAESFLKIVTDESGQVDPTTQILLAMFSSFAEFDRDQIVKKLREGKMKRIMSGYPLGGGKIPYGYKYVPNQDKYGNYVAVPEEKEKILEIRRLFVEEHIPPAKIADRLGMTSEALVINILKRRTYLNLIEYKGREYPGKFEAFITEEQWEQQQEEFARRSRAKSNTHYLFTGLLYCGNCGSRMRYQKDGDGELKIYCYSKEKSLCKRHIAKSNNCPNKIRYNAADIESVVLKAFFEICYENRGAKKTVSTYDILANLEKDRDKKSKMLTKAINDSLFIDEFSVKGAAYKKAIDELSEEIEKIDKKIKSEKEKQKLSNQAIAAQKKMKEIIDMWDCMSQENRRTVCREFIKKITISYEGPDVPPKIDIKFILEDFVKQQ